MTQCAPLTDHVASPPNVARAPGELRAAIISKLRGRERRVIAAFVDVAVADVLRCALRRSRVGDLEPTTRRSSLNFLLAADATHRT